MLWLHSTPKYAILKKQNLVQGRIFMSKEKTSHKRRLLLYLLCTPILFFLLVVGGLNLAKFAIYMEYYSIETNVCKNPGLSDGFVCQGICVSGEKILVSGYMKDDSPSRIYITDRENNSYFVSLFYGSQKAFTGHAGGIAISGDFAYIAGGEKLYVLPLSELFSAGPGEAVHFSKIVPVGLEASCVSADKDYIYVGEFHDGNSHIANHPYETPVGAQHAIVARFPVSEIESYHKTNNPSVSPDKVYSVRNNVQGVCFAPNGFVVLSTSYDIADTIYYVYSEADAIPSDYTWNGAPVYYLCDTVRSVNGPAMGEDLDYYEGKILTLTESASDKYIFGKFFFADQIVALDLVPAK